MKKNNTRITRINEEIRNELSAIIARELKDPRIHPMTTVVRVETTPDLKFCKVFISVLGNEEEQLETADGLKSSAGFIRNILAKKINLRNTPELHFVNDHSIEYGVKMTKLINDVNKGNN